MIKESAPITLPRLQGKTRNLRWYICGLLFFATAINYLDRQTLSVLAPYIRADLHITSQGYSYIVSSFLLVYGVMYTLSGRAVDRLGTRRGFSLSIVWWSLATALHALARGVMSFSIFRALLAVGEAGNFPAATKSVAEWFPPKERALAVAIFNTGSSLGSIIAPPLVAWIAIVFGWRAAFLVTGVLGFLWLTAWLLFYRTPRQHPRITQEELNYIESEQAAESAAAMDALPGEATESQTLRWRDLLKYKQVYGIVIARMLSDSVGFFYIFWLPDYLKRERGFSLEQIGMFLWIPFVAEAMGNLVGGWLSSHLIKRGWSINGARKFTMAVGALMMPAGIAAVRVGSPTAALLLICAITFGHSVWIANLLTLPSDIFPPRAVATVSGFSGTGGSLGGMVFTLMAGMIVDKYSYVPIFTIGGLMHPIALLVLLSMGRIERLVR
jgi:ACS family hexuronate transporter-like MFS transporter